MQNQREFFADKLMDLANYAATALIFGQMVGGQRLVWPALAIGTALLLVLGLVSYFLTKGGKRP